MSDNIYKKMQKARCEFQEKPLEKSGHNKFSNYRYFELKDFLPTINALLEKYNLCSSVSFTKEEATLMVINSDNIEERMVFTSPMSVAAIKGCHEVQNLGAVQTYLRRYLWINAFEIVESDGLDSATGKEELQPGDKTKTNVAINKCEKLLKTKAVDKASVMQFVKTTYGVEKLSDLNLEQANNLISILESHPNA